jgi:hypothetical protein
MTDTTTFESIDLSDSQRKSQRERTAIEFFREKFADADDEETVEVIDPKAEGADEEATWRGER